MRRGEVTTYRLTERQIDEIRNKLFEAFKRPELAWISTMMNRIYDNPSAYKEIAKDYKCEIELTSKVKPKHEDWYVLEAEYSETKDVFRFSFSKKAIASILEF